MLMRACIPGANRLGAGQWRRTIPSRKAHARKGILLVGPIPPKSIGGIATYVEEVRQRIRCSHVDTPAVESFLGKVLRFLRTAYAIIKNRSACRVLHLHSASGRSFYEKGVFVILGRMLGYRCILHIHSGRFDRFVRGSWMKWPIRAILMKCDLNIVLSAALRETVREIAPGANVVVLANGVDVGEKMPESAAGSRVLFLGAVADKKGVPELLQAFSQVVRMHPTASLALAGPVDPADKRRYEKELDRLGIRERVEFLGTVTGLAKQGLIRSSAVFVLPSRAEGLPIALLEAMAEGCPPVASRVGGIPEVIRDGENGYVVEPGDVDSLAERITRLLGDAALREAIRLEAWRTVREKYNIERMMANIIDVYERLGASVERLGSVRNFL